MVLSRYLAFFADFASATKIERNGTVRASISRTPVNNRRISASLRSRSNLESVNRITTEARSIDKKFHDVHLNHKKNGNSFQQVNGGDERTAFPELFLQSWQHRRFALAPEPDRIGLAFSLLTAGLLNR